MLNSTCQQVMTLSKGVDIQSLGLPDRVMRMSRRLDLSLEVSLTMTDPLR